MKLVLKNSELIFSAKKDPISLLDNVLYVLNKGWHKDSEEAEWTFAGTISYVAAACVGNTNNPIPIPSGASIIYYNIYNNASVRNSLTLVDSNGNVLYILAGSGVGQINLEEYPTASAIYANFSSKGYDGSGSDGTRPVELKTYIEDTNGQFLKYV